MVASLNTMGVNEPRQTVRPLQDFPHEILLNIIAYADFNDLRRLRATRREFANLISAKMLDESKREYIGQMVDYERQRIHRLALSLPNGRRDLNSTIRLSADGSSECVTSLTCYGCHYEKDPSQFSAESLKLPFFLPPPTIKLRMSWELQNRVHQGFLVGPVKPPALDRRCRTCNLDRYHPLPNCVECGAVGGWKVCDLEEWIASKGIYCKWDYAFAPRVVLDTSRPSHRVGPLCLPCRTRYWENRRLSNIPNRKTCVSSRVEFNYEDACLNI